MRSDRKDAHYKRAKAEGYRARSAYKLIELDDRHRFLARSRRVLDVGAWPGGWLQVAAERTRPETRLVGVDLDPLQPFSDSRVQCLVGDVTDPELHSALLDALGGHADVLLSDASPKLTGVTSTDQARLERLGIAVLDAADALLTPHGTLVMKTFTGPSGVAVRTVVERKFTSVKAVRLDATRRGSSEMYLIARGRR